MIRTFFCLCCLFFSVLWAGSAAAEQVNVDNVLFEVTGVQRVAASDKRPGYLVVKYQLTNQDDKRKLSLDRPLACRIVDEFGNEYRQLTDLFGAGEGERIRPNSFPSIYPGEIYGETLFFEKPVARANEIRFIINAESLGILATVQIPLRLNPEMETGVEISEPLDGAVLDQGEVVHLNVRIKGGAVPKRVIVLAFGQTYTDNNPALENVYDVNIPPEQPLGPYIINVIAQWRPEHDSVTRSSYINVTVKDALPLDVL